MSGERIKTVKVPMAPRVFYNWAHRHWFENTPTGPKLLAYTKRPTTPYNEGEMADRIRQILHRARKP